MVDLVVRALLEPYLQQEALDRLSDTIVNNSWLHYEDQGKKMDVLWESGLASGLKLTSVCGSIINLCYVLISKC